MTNNMRKRTLGGAVAWILYWMGDAVSHVMLWSDWAGLYPVYSKLMCASADVQDWSGGVGPWSQCAPSDKDDALGRY